MVFLGPTGSFLGLTRINMQVSRDPEEIVHFYWGENRVKISLLFLTSEALDIESEHVFESHGQLQSAADIMPALTSFKMNQIGPNLGQIWAKSTQNSQLWK